MKRLVVIGMDGLDKEVLDVLMKAGRLPHLSELAAGGFCSELLSTLPNNSGPSWTTAITGVDPGAHGIYDFTDPRNSARVMSSTTRKVKTVFDIVGRFGKVIAINVPFTYPPWEINGVMVAGWPRPSDNPPHVLPSSYLEAVSRCWKPVSRNQGLQGMLDHPEMGYRSALVSARAVRDTTEYLLSSVDDWLLSFVVFNLPDFFQHFLLRDKSPPEAVARVYQTLDSYFFDIWSKFSDDKTAFMVISDHGGQPVSKCFSGNAWLAQRGLRRVSRWNRMKAELYVLSRRNWIIGRGMAKAPGRLFDRTRELASTPHVKQPIACTHVGFVLFDGARIPRAEVERALREMRKVSYRGRRVVKEIHDLSRLYTPSQDNPDYLIELEPGFDYGTDDCLSAVSGMPFNIVADHSRGGAVLLGEAAGPKGRTPEMIDVAPTILQITCGGRVDYMRGQSLVGSQGARLLEVEKQGSAVRGASYSSSEEQAIHDRLRSLGYE